MKTPIDREIVDGLVADLGIKDFAKATIREVKQVAAKAEKASGVEFIKMEMGIPGLPAAQVGVDAQIKALESGIAHSYPDIQGAPVLKEAASQFVKAFIGVDIQPEGCIPVSGSMQGTFASFLTCSQCDKKKDTVLFIDPGFPVQKMQLQVMGVKFKTFDVYDYRGDKLQAKLESYLSEGNICAIVYSNPNNPSWICLREEELKVIGDLATKYDVVVMEDLAYFAMDFRKDLSKPFEAPYQATVARYTDNYMLLISGSKAFSYAGERIGVTCISDQLFHRHFDDLSERYQGLPFGPVFSTRMLYALSSGTSHSAQYAMAAMLKAAYEGKYDFRKDLSTPFQPPYQATVARYTDNYMLLISGSKAFSYAGERIGVTCISDKLFHRHFDDLSERYQGLAFGPVFSTRMLYALSSGTSHSAQYALAAMLKAAYEGKYDFRKEISVYGERAKKLKEIFCRHKFYVVYDKDLDEPIADGFYFTIGYPGMTSGQLAHELMYYGVSAICLITCGSEQEGLRVCTSFIEDHQYAMLEERMALFEKNKSPA